LTDIEPRNPLSDWAVPGGLTAFLVVVGREKFSSEPEIGEPTLATFRQAHDRSS